MGKIFIFLGIFISGSCFSIADDAAIEEYNRMTSYLMNLGDEQLKEKNQETMTLLYSMVHEREKNEEHWRE